MIVGIMSPKGGCGKSTTTLALASALATNEELSVTVVDADPRQSLARVWSEKRRENKLPLPDFALISEISEDGIIDRLSELNGTSDVVFVDLEGVAGLMSSYVASLADMCIVPMRPSALDGDAAGAALKLISSTGRVSKRTIPAFVLLTQTDAAITTRSHRELLEELDSNQVGRFKVELMRRAPYERMMAEGRTLFEMDDNKSVVSARGNALALASEMAELWEAKEWDS